MQNSCGAAHAVRQCGTTAVKCNAAQCRLHACAVVPFFSVALRTKRSRNETVASFCFNRLHSRLFLLPLPADGPEVGQEIGGYVLPFTMEAAPAALGGGRNRDVSSHTEERILVVGQVSRPKTLGCVDDDGGGGGGGVCCCCWWWWWWWCWCWCWWFDCVSVIGGVSFFFFVVLLYLLRLLLSFVLRDLVHLHVVQHCYCPGPAVVRPSRVSRYPPPPSSNVPCPENRFCILLWYWLIGCCFARVLLCQRRGI